MCGLPRARVRPAARRRARGERDGAASGRPARDPRRRRARPRVRRHPRRAVRSGRRGAAARLRARAAARPATCWAPPRSGGGSCSIPRAARSTTSSPPRSTARSARPRRGPSGRPTTPRPGSTSAARTPRACSGASCATRSSPRRATASSIKLALERAIELDSGLEDAYFGIGMYKYYADVAPTAAKILRFLLLLPGGDRKEGLAQMLRARNRGRLLQGEADYQLHIVYLWYERQTPRALRAAPLAARALSRQSALPRADRRHPGSLPARRDRQPRDLADACWPRRANSAPTRRC